MSLSKSLSRYTASWSARGVSERDISHIQDKWNFLWFAEVEHDTFFAWNGNSEKIRDPDGIRTHDPLWPSPML